jgi:hypothetical protein
MSPPCPGCSAPVSETARFCRACGRALPSTRAPAATPGHPPFAGRTQEESSEHEDSSTVISLQPGGELGSDPAQASDDAQSLTPAPAVEPDAPSDADVHAPAGGMNCEVCGATASDGTGVCPECARLVGPVEGTGD